jgi:hypothetical protein
MARTTAKLLKCCNCSLEAGLRKRESTLHSQFGSLSSYGFALRTGFGCFFKTSQYTILRIFLAKLFRSSRALARHKHFRAARYDWQAQTGSRCQHAVLIGTASLVSAGASQTHVGAGRDSCPAVFILHVHGAPSWLADSRDHR